jgi:hypothetical protein
VHPNTKLIMHISQVVVAPLIKKMETIDLISPKVIMSDADEVFHLTHEIHDTLNESNNQFKEFLQEVMNMVPSITSIIP